MTRAWVALLASGLVASAGPAAIAQTFGSPTHFTEQGGAAIYASVCAACHMPDGQGAEGAGRYPALSRDPRLQIPAYPIFMILHGQGAMPPFARTLTDQQIADVVAYIQTHFGNAEKDQATSAAVKAARASD
ncbi:cytochrome c [Acidisoma cellulosilytica]|uniref:Cytochrome c n=1 Tax=Acidisoma cellulosilyticum TaxID=2802395 RepID=A0A963Z3E9_9PROT|nr:cytochrome c [Acidisoma cellulosilyticum]MCB8882103.1 cytochrome c [Acidisoma cellulosilyticum]